MTCVIDGCDRKVDAKWCLCVEHWRTVPEDLRAALSRAYNHYQPIDGQSTGFRLARTAVQVWIRKTFGAEEARAKPSWEQLVASVRERDVARGRATPPSPATDAEHAPQPAQLRLVE